MAAYKATTISASAETLTCTEQRRLLDAEQALRARAKAEPDMRVAAVLANFSLHVQRLRHGHEETCLACMNIQAGRAAA